MALTDHVVGVDVGASTISAGLVCPATAPSSRDAQAPAAGGNAVDTITRPDRSHPAAGRARRLRVAGIGIGLPGLIDVEKGRARAPGAWLPELDDVPLPSSRGAHRAARVRGQRRQRPRARGMDVRRRARRVVARHDGDRHRRRGGDHPGRHAHPRPHRRRGRDRPPLGEPRRAALPLRSRRLPRHLSGGGLRGRAGPGAARGVSRLRGAGPRRRGPGPSARRRVRGGGEAIRSPASSSTRAARRSPWASARS